MKYRNLIVLSAILLSLFSSFAGAAAEGTRTISADQLRDKIAGGWAGKMIGVTYGAPTEFRALQKLYLDPITWTPADIRGSMWQDDIYVQLTFLMAMDQFGMDAPVKNLQEMLAKAGYPLWCANMQARKNYFDGIYPPESGNPEYSYRADDIDFQIEADYIGFMNPGMPQNVVDMCWKIGHIMNYGDGVYGGIFIDAMYSAAYFENDIMTVINKGLEALPPGSDYARIVRDVIRLHKHYPNDWKGAWAELDTKWGDVDISGAGSPFNIDAKLNGAYIVMGLLYGNGDIDKTLEISTRCGQDSDCNPSNAMAVLGVIKGFSNLPAEMQNGVRHMGDSLFINTTYSFNSAVESTYKYALTLIKANGGKLENNIITLPVQEVVPAKLEVSFPNVVYERNASVFSDAGWKFKGNWQPYMEKSWDQKSEKEQSKYSANPGDEAEFTFSGTGVSIMGNWFKDGGQADVYLDGKLTRSIDTYYEYSNQEHASVSIWHVFQLAPGSHTIKIVVKGSSNPLSKGKNVYIREAVVYKTGLKKNDSWRFSFE
ncbi:MAG: ADP-ribosylglycohydrolase family protein [Bacteroidales bacterium]|nr:ADP-ribosylglycohydrolase family protein [Bacteroidales bacterium]